MRRFRFSIRGLMLAVAAAAAVGWVWREIDLVLLVWPAWPALALLSLWDIGRIERKAPEQRSWSIPLLILMTWSLVAIAYVSVQILSPTGLGLLVVFLGMFALIFLDAFRGYDRATREGRKRLIFLLGMALSAIVAVGLLLPVIQAARRSR